MEPRAYPLKVVALGLLALVLAAALVWWLVSGKGVALPPESLRWQLVGATPDRRGLIVMVPGALLTECDRVEGRMDGRSSSALTVRLWVREVDCFPENLVEHTAGPVTVELPDGERLNGATIGGPGFSGAYYREYTPVARRQTPSVVGLRTELAVAVLRANRFDPGDATLNANTWVAAQSPVGGASVTGGRLPPKVRLTTRPRS